MDTAQRLLDILEVFLGKEGELGIVEISKLSNVNTTTAYRIAADLVKRGYLKQKEKRGKYSLGIKLLEFHAAIQRNLKIGELAQPFLQNLSKLSGEYTEIAILESFTAVTIAQAEVDQNLRILNLVGERLPLHATSLGKVLLAYMNAADRKGFYTKGNLGRFTDSTITDVNRLEQEIDIIKKQGFAIDNEEYGLGVWAVAAPVYGQNGFPVASLAIAAPSARTSKAKRKELTVMVQVSSLEISRELGYKTRMTK
jgi:DNA-binding IclR family transcriptional regulator